MNRAKMGILTLGCRVNQYESVALSDRAREAGFEVCGWLDGAEVGLLNSCALTALAERKTRRAINDFMRANPGGRVAVTGCFAQVNPEAVAAIGGVAWVIPNSAKMNSAELILSHFEEGGVKIFPESAEGRNFEGLSGRGALSDRINLKIQDGCDNACAYCIIPRARGAPRSREVGAILSDAEKIVARGAAEIVVTGINISKFDAPGVGLVGLIDRLDAIGGLKRIRIGSLEPPDFPLEALLERMADSSHKLCPHLHVSAQSLNDSVLRAMRRRYKCADFLNIVARARSLCPDISIGADIVCGHPGEGAREFADTLEKAKDSGLSYVHAFAFSPRPMTAAAQMAGAVPRLERASRAAQMRAVSDSLRAAFFKSQFGKVRPLLLENMVADGVYLAHSDNYIGCVVRAGAPGMKNCVLEARIGNPVGAGRVEAFAVPPRGAQKNANASKTPCIGGEVV